MIYGSINVKNKLDSVGGNSNSRSTIKYKEVSFHESKDDDDTIDEIDNNSCNKTVTFWLIGLVSISIAIVVSLYFALYHKSVTLSSSISGASKSSLPNIVFILTDDQGMGDMDITGGDFDGLMPNVRRYNMAGVNFTQYYSASLCTPARASLLTGKYPINTGMQHGVIMGTMPWGLPLAEKLMSSYFFDAGYKTYLVGKWHLGHYSKSHLPTARGFDHAFGYYGGYQHPTTYFYEWPGCTNKTGCIPDMHDDNQVYSRDGQFNIDTFADKTEDVIYNHVDGNDGMPFFLYLPIPLIHMPVHPDPLVMSRHSVELESISNKWRKKMGGMAIMLDTFFNRVMTALIDTDQMDNSIIIFASDNGAQVEGSQLGAGSNYPLRGAKGSLYEGGIRVPAFLYSPLLGHSVDVDGVNTGSNYTSLFHVTDWLPSLISGALGRSDLLNSTSLDGINQWDYLSQSIGITDDDANNNAPRQQILYNIDTLTGIAAIRKGNWKLIVNESVNVGWFDGVNFGIDFCGIDATETVQLFNLRDDEQERYDVSVDNGEIVAELQALIDVYTSNQVDTVYCSDSDDSAAVLWFDVNQIEPWIEMNDGDAEYTCPTVERMSGWCASVDASDTIITRPTIIPKPNTATRN